MTSHINGYGANRIIRDDLYWGDQLRERAVGDEGALGAPAAPKIPKAAGNKAKKEKTGRQSLEAVPCSKFKGYTDMILYSDDLVPILVISCKPDPIYG